MGRLGAKDLEAALAFALEAQSAESIAELRSGLLPELRRLVPCDSLGYNEIDLRQGTALGIVDPPSVNFPGMVESFLGVAHQHPLLARQAQGELHTQALSDHLSVRELHRLELYHDFYRHIDAEDQLAFGLGGEVVVAFALCRSRRSFTARDRDLLDLVRPYIAAAYRHAQARQQELEFLVALDRELEHRHVGLVQLDPRDRVVHQSAGAEELLEAYSMSGRSAPGHLPPKLAKWVKDEGARAPAELVIEGARGRLRVRDGSQAPATGWRTLLLEEDRALPPSIESLCELGLTRRQAQVLRLVAAGKPNQCVAAELGIATDTVEKHLEHIYARLGVDNRTRAVAVAGAG